MPATTLPDPRYRRPPGRPRSGRERMVLAIDADVTEHLRTMPAGKRAAWVNAVLRRAVTDAD